MCIHFIFLDSRTIVDIPTEGAVFDDHIKTVFLEEELRHYKHQSRYHTALTYCTKIGDS